MSLFFDNLDVTALKLSRKPRVPDERECVRSWFKFPVNKKTKHEK